MVGNSTSNVTFEYTVTPSSHGAVLIPRATVKYDDKTAHIDADLRTLIETPAQYAKRTDRHIVCPSTQHNAHTHAQQNNTDNNRSTGQSTWWRLC